MAIHVVRIEHQGRARWGLQHGEAVSVLDLPCTTTAALLALGHDGVQGAPVTDTLRAADAAFLAPVTAPAKVLCQGANYRQHMLDSGMDPAAKTFNMFFTKSTASITGPRGSIVKPAHVTLLDYEVELALVLGKRTHGPVSVSAANLHEYVAGICIGNDVSARDIQVPQMQFHKGKSYRTFCPLGPVLCLLGRSEMHYLDDLQLTLAVNGERRQHDNTRNLVFKPAETLTEYSQVADFEPGDVLLTGTPSGCALSLPSPAMVRLSALLPERTKWSLFLKSQRRRPQYLQAGDRVECTISSSDGRIDLGRQEHVVVAGH